MNRHLRLSLALTLFVAGTASAQTPIVLKGHKAPVTHLAISADGKFLVTAGAKIKFDFKTMKLEEGLREGKGWTLEAPRETFAFSGFGGMVLAMSVSPDGQSFATAGGDMTGFKVVDGAVVYPPGDLRIWNARDGKLSKTLPAQKGIIQAVAFSPDGRTLASGSFGGAIYFWNAKDGTQIEERKAHAGPVMALAYARGGEMASAAGDGIRLWDPAGKPLHQIKGSMMSLALTSDGKTLAASEMRIFVSDIKEKFAITLYDTASGKEKGTLRGHKGQAHSISFSADGALLASAGDDGFLKLWDVAAAKHRADLLTGEAGAVHTVAFSPDGRWLAAGSYDRRIRVWPAGKLPGR